MLPRVLSCCREVMEKSFPEYYDYYESVCRNNAHLTGQNMQVSRIDAFICDSKWIQVAEC